MKIDPSIERDWLQWQQEEHIPEVMASGQFTEYRFYKMLEQEDPEMIIYVIQYFANSMHEYQRYIKEYAPSLREKVTKKWGDKFIGFRTLMQAV